MLILYYAVMIFLDIQKEKAAKAAEQERNHEEEIDISDEASTFKPVMITRDEPKKAPCAEKPAGENSNTPDKTKENAETKDKKQDEAKDLPQETKNESVVNFEKNTPDNTPSKSEASSKKPDSSDSNDNETKKEEKINVNTIKREGYREAYMTDGIPVEQIIQQVDEYAETGKGPLGEIIFECRSAQF